MAKINVQNTEITIVSHNDDDYISLTDMARSQLQEHIIFRWLSLKSTIEYLGERLVKLNQIAIQQMQVLEGNEGRKLLM